MDHSPLPMASWPRYVVAIIRIQTRDATIVSTPKDVNFRLPLLSHCCSINQPTGVFNAAGVERKALDHCLIFL